MEHRLCGCGWMFFFVLLNGAVIVGVVVLVVCVWRVWQCVKSGQVCCCSFGGEIRSRCGFQCQELRWYVLGEFQVAAEF